MNDFHLWTNSQMAGPSNKPITYIYVHNKLASLKVTLVCNYDPPIKQLNDAESIATRVAKKHQELIINYQLPRWYITIYSNILV